jgi:very-short-patch-repair endonuclease
MLIEKYRSEEKNNRGKRISRAVLECDKCKTIFDERWANTLDKQKKRKEHLCKNCLNELMSKLSSERLTLTKANQPEKERIENASKAGKASQKTGMPSKTWFSSNRWNSMSEEDQKNQVMKAAKASVAKLNSMSEEELADHYRKVMKGGIGFVSKGQQELEDNLIHLGFEGNQQIGRMNVDLCHYAKKIVIEFNGDAYHCNPKIWKKDQYSTLIKMTAGEKWKKDIARYAILRKFGYKVIVVWESNWKASKETCLKLIKEIYENC